MNAREKQLMDEFPLMKCGNRAEFQQRLQWLSEGMLRSHLSAIVNYVPDQSEIDAYRRYKADAGRT